MRAAFRLSGIVLALAAALPLAAADLTPERIRFEASLPLDAVGLPPGPYLVSGTLTAGGTTLGKFYRVPRLRLPCPRPPCAAVVQVEVPFKGVTEALLGAFLDGPLAAEASAEFKCPETGEARRAGIPLDLSPAALGLDEETLGALVRVGPASLEAASGGIRLRLLLFNPFPFPARLKKVDMEVRPGTRNAYPLTDAPDLELPPGETEHETAVRLKAEDLLVIASRKVATEQYTLAVEVRLSGTLTVEIAGRTVQLNLP